MTMQELLQSTIDYYSADTRRICKLLSGGCKYSPKTAYKEGISEGCAIGRHLSPENKEEMDELGMRYGCSDIKTLIEIPEARKLLPEWMVSMSWEFLAQIQQLHDSSGNWDEKGITRDGKNYVETIVREFGLHEITYTN